jgi:hypothetical protein
MFQKLIIFQLEQEIKYKFHSIKSNKINLNNLYSHLKLLSLLDISQQKLINFRKILFYMKNN